MKTPKFLRPILEKEVELFQRDKFFRSLEYLTNIVISVTTAYTLHKIGLEEYKTALYYAGLSGLTLFSRITLELEFKDNTYKNKA